MKLVITLAPPSTMTLSTCWRAKISINTTMSIKRKKRHFTWSKSEAEQVIQVEILNFVRSDNSDIKPPLPVVDPERFYRSGEK